MSVEKITKTQDQKMHRKKAIDFKLYVLMASGISPKDAQKTLIGEIAVTRCPGLQILKTHDASHSLHLKVPKISPANVFILFYSF